MAGMKGRSGGRRPGAGRPRLNPKPHEMMRVIEDIQARLARIERQEYGALMLRRLIAIERHLRLVEMPATPHPSRRRPLGAE